MRGSGILMPVFSLPGNYGIGCFSKEAYKFVDFLKEAGQTYWQILPLGPTSYGDSPYQSFSTFAGNPYFIDLDSLKERGLIKQSEIDKADFGSDERKIAYDKLYKHRFKLLHKAYERSNIYENPSFHEFKKNNEYWLRDYARFMAIKDFFKGVSFYEWPDDIRYRHDYAISYYEEKLYFDIEFYEFLQFEFFTEWMDLKKYANENGIKIIGDIPIYVAADSADVWAHPELFQMDDTGMPSAVAGCPPDSFAKEGQLWGNPLYRWDYHSQTGYDWWIRRMKKCRELYDVIRIDHFRGFDEYYSVPFGAPNAVNGHWEKGPGINLFNTINYYLQGIEIIAEDLGFITDSVRRLVKDSGYPNMKVLEFAFDSRDSSGAQNYLPYNYDTNCVVYTGTHDNETVKGWLKSILPKEVKMISDYVGAKDLDEDELVDTVIRMAMSSTARLCVIPLQDYLHMENEARINHPSTIGTNWLFRFKSSDMTKKLAKRILTETKKYGR